jgi:hypothetical protein
MKRKVVLQVGECLGTKVTRILKEEVNNVYIKVVVFQTVQQRWGLQPHLLYWVRNLASQTGLSG